MMDVFIGNKFIYFETLFNMANKYIPSMLVSIGEVYNQMTNKICYRIALTHSCTYKHFSQSHHLLDYGKMQHSAQVDCSARDCNSVQCSAVQCSAVQCSAVQCSAEVCSVVKWSVVQLIAMQYSEVQCSAVQCRGVQCSVVNF